MKQHPPLQKIIIPIVALMVGLIIGLGVGLVVGQFQVKKEQKVFESKMKEASKKIAFLQKKMAEEKAEATVSTDQRCQNDLDKLESERKALEIQLGKLKEQARNVEAELREQVRSLEAKIKQIDEASTKTKKELQEEKQKYAQASQNKNDLEREQEKTKAEKRALQQTLQAELERTIQNLGRCEVNNAKLCLIAEEIVKAYQDKGIGATLLGKEPLTQIKKVELEQLTQKYREEIEKQKIKKK